MLYIKVLRVFFAILVLSPVSSAFALPHNLNPLPIPACTSTCVDYPIVQNAKVVVISTDWGKTGNIVWQLVTTDTSSSGYVNECSSAPGSPHYFFVSAVDAGTDNKLQKLMSMLQVAQLTGMQITITGITVTGSGSDCSVGNIQHIYLRNTTY